MNKNNNKKVKKFKKVFKRVFLLLLILILISCIWIYVTLSSLNNGNETTATDKATLKNL